MLVFATANVKHRANVKKDLLKCNELKEKLRWKEETDNLIVITKTLRKVTPFVNIIMLLEKYIVILYFAMKNLIFFLF